jgi:hypothetical protein
MTRVPCLKNDGNCSPLRAERLADTEFGHLHAKACRCPRSFDFVRAHFARDDLQGFLCY